MIAFNNKKQLTLTTRMLIRSMHREIYKTCTFYKKHDHECEGGGAQLLKLSALTGVIEINVIINFNSTFIAITIGLDNIIVITIVSTIITINTIFIYIVIINDVVFIASSFFITILNSINITPLVFIIINITALFTITITTIVSTLS